MQPRGTPKCRILQSWMGTGQSPASRTHLSQVCRTPSGEPSQMQLSFWPSQVRFAGENSVEELISPYADFWQGINAHSKCTNV